ncbi:PACE efflux transporter [Shewanella halifaxensis]|uniref:PACE efflux transporter n=1 Tax=Shewanella halifaxensis TaxID=271098 RepID=UPI000D58FF14|nr:PACE efflux transporter [Shewanella halifaxensis]
MSIKERILHSILFELVALTLLIGFSQVVSDYNPLSVGGLAIMLSMSAMTWNYIYNLGFDKVFGSNRIARSLLLRVGHGVGFEIGLLMITTPLIMWTLKLGFVAVIVINLGLSLFFLIYAIVFNWAYDHISKNVKSAYGDRCKELVS